MSTNCLPQITGLNEGGTNARTASTARLSLGFTQYTVATGSGTVVSGQPSIAVVLALVVTGDKVFVTPTGTSINTIPLTVVSVTNGVGFTVGTVNASNATADYLFSYTVLRAA